MFDTRKSLHFVKESGRRRTRLCSNGVAQSVPESSLLPTVSRSQGLRLPSNVCRCPNRVPDSRCGLLLSRPRHVKAVQEGEGGWEGTLVLALTGVAYLKSRMGGSVPPLSSRKSFLIR